MLGKFTLGLFAAAALAAMALAPSAASARGAGGWGGGSFHNHQSSPRLGTRFIGPAVQKTGLGTRFIGPAVHRPHRHGFGIGFIGASYLGPSYIGYRYLDDGCYVVRRVPPRFRDLPRSFLHFVYFSGFRFLSLKKPAP